MRAEGSFTGSNFNQQVFATTHWSIVRAAAPRDGPAACEALEKLCRIYWYPLYAFVRRQGHTPEDAQDLTQSFFGHILTKDFLRMAAPAKGRFRSFLLASLKNFLSDQWHKSRAHKRGGPDGGPTIPLEDAENRYSGEPLAFANPEFIYDRRWALDLLDRVLERLLEELTASGKSLPWEQLKAFLLGQGEETYAELGSRLGMSESKVKMTIFRLRQRYRKLLLEEISQTVNDPDEAREEMRYLLSVVSQ